MNKDLIEKAKIELTNIENNNASWKSSFAYEMEIWEEIAENINDTTGKNKKFWNVVMDLYNEKYKNNKQ